MQKDLIVEIYVPVCGSDGQSGEIATGYPVTRERILTARHPLFPDAPGRDEQHPIEVRWRHPGVDRDWHPARGIAWESERWDLALLECELPKEISPWGGFPSETRPDDAMQWCSVGFPRVGGKRDGVREPFHMHGGVYSMLEEDETFAIDEVAGPSEADAWKGASGSPVFVDWRILGVVVSVPEDLQARRLRAVPLWRVLREEPAFCTQVGYDQRKERRDGMLARVQQALSPLPAKAAIDALAAQLPGLPARLKEESGRREKAATLAKHLLDLEIDRVIDICQRAQRALVGDPAVATITDVVQLILPAVYDHGVVETVRNACGDVAASLLTLPACFPTVAEIIMAGVDRRETEFCPREHEGHFPKGQLNLPEPPECGFDGDGMEALAALDQHLTGKFSWEHAEKFAEAVDDFMIKRFPDQAPAGANRTRTQSIEAAADEIEYQATRNGRTYYLIVRQPEDPQDRAGPTETLSELRTRYRGLLCFSLDTDSKARRAERRSFRPLLDLLPKKRPDLR